MFGGQKHSDFLFFNYFSSIFLINRHPKEIFYFSCVAVKSLNFFIKFCKHKFVCFPVGSSSLPIDIKSLLRDLSYNISTCPINSIFMPVCSNFLVLFNLSSIVPHRSSSSTNRGSLLGPAFFSLNRVCLLDSIPSINISIVGGLSPNSSPRNYILKLLIIYNK